MKNLTAIIEDLENDFVNGNISDGYAAFKVLKKNQKILILKRITITDFETSLTKPQISNLFDLV